MPKTIACYCCGRDTEAVTLVANVPQALHQRMVVMCDHLGLHRDHFIQKALDLQLRMIEDEEREPETDEE